MQHSSWNRNTTQTCLVKVHILLSAHNDSLFRIIGRVKYWVKRAFASDEWHGHAGSCYPRDGHAWREIRMPQLNVSQCSWLVSSLSDHARSSARQLIFVWKANILRENLQLQIAIIWVSDKHIISTPGPNMSADDILWQSEIICKNSLSLELYQAQWDAEWENITRDTWHYVTIRYTSHVTMSRPSSLTRLGSLLSPNSPRSFRKHVKLDFPDLNGEQLVRISFFVYARWQQLCLLRKIL